MRDDDDDTKWKFTLICLICFRFFSSFFLLQLIEARHWNCIRNNMRCEMGLFQRISLCCLISNFMENFWIFEKLWHEMARYGCFASATKTYWISPVFHIFTFDDVIQAHEVKQTYDRYSYWPKCSTTYGHHQIQ